jgi:hypothetical protein
LVPKGDDVDVADAAFNVCQQDAGAVNTKRAM